MVTLSTAWLDELRARTVLSAVIAPTVKLIRAGREWNARQNSDAGFFRGRHDFVERLLIQNIHQHLKAIHFAVFDQKETLGHCADGKYDDGSSRDRGKIDGHRGKDMYLHERQRRVRGIGIK